MLKIMLVQGCNQIFTTFTTLITFRNQSIYKILLQLKFVAKFLFNIAKYFIAKLKFQLSEVFLETNKYLILLEIL